MIFRTKNFRGPKGYIAAQQILSDDEHLSFVQMDEFGYLFLCQSKSGSRHNEVELTHGEAVKLKDFLVKSLHLEFEQENQ